MTRVLFVGQDPKTVDFADPALPPGTTTEQIARGIELAAQKIGERGWQGDLCMITPDDAGIARLKAMLAERTYDGVVNAVHQAAPGAAIAFNTRPEDTADAAARWLTA